MATKKKRGRPAGSKNTASAPQTKSPAKAESKENSKGKAKRQALAIVLFTVSLFLLFVVLIEGQNVWSMMHYFLFGIFGICAYILPFILCYVSIMLALDKMFEKIRIKIFEACALISLIGAAIEVFTHSAGTEGFFAFLSQAYKSGLEIKGGGFLGSVISYPLQYLFGSTGAKITVVLLVFALLMLITGTTLMSLFKTAAKPVQNIQKHYIEKRESKAKFDIDVDLGAMPEHPVESSLPFFDEGEDSPADKSQRLIDAYNDNPPKEKDAEPKLEEIVDREAKKQEEKEEEKPKKSAKKDNDMPPTGVTVESATPAVYRYPPVSLLNRNIGANSAQIGDELKANAEKLVNTLKSFGVETRIINISRGPAVTRYELQPSAGVKISKITNLADDIALNLAASAVRIEAPIPNKSAVGIEIPNKLTSVVSMSEIVESAAFTSQKSKLTAALGKDISGNIATCDIAKMPHMLIAGSTGSGKSVCINSIIISLLYKASPDEVKLLMIDPKVVELGVYNGIPHLLVPVVTDPRKAAGALGWAVTEMLKRYKIFADNSVRDLASYNSLCKERDDLNPMPQIVIVIDELADLMMAAPNEVEDSICRLAQMARAAGMHLLIATQRPSVDVITGIIKANIPSRIAFAVSSQVDSRTILDMGGAEKLMGKGDMLYFPIGMSKPLRVQGCFVSDKEINAVVDFIKNSAETNEYDQEVISEIEKQAVVEKKGRASEDSDSDGGDGDERLNDAIEVVVEAGIASTSLLQRKLKLGYARAARIIDEMEEKGIVGPFEGSKPRKVLITKQQWLERQARGNDDE
ncbi:MAG: DNA translocase FtsK 4TM domain-containing protein [Clostridia bacterium]|nr:DNA translocase FtsK 4TM domain-containing protein [Clostridia bacterium]